MGGFQNYELDRVSGEAYGALLIFAPWVIVEIISLIKTKKIHDSPFIIFIPALIFIILLEKILSFSGILGFSHLLFVFSIVWFFYIIWIVLFLLAGVFMGSGREKIYLSLRNVIAFILILITCIILKSKGRERLFGNWGPPFPLVYYLSCITALGFALIGIYGYGYRDKDNFSMAWLKKFKKKRRIVLLGILGLFLLPRYLGPVITPWLHYTEAHSPVRAKILRVKHDLKSTAKALEDYFSDHGSCPNYILGFKNSANGFARGVEQDRLIGIPSFEISDGRSLHTLTTPHVYIKRFYTDVFSPVKGSTFAYYSINGNKESEASGWVLWSAGPDGIFDLDIQTVKKYYDPNNLQPSRELLAVFAWDPTNGTESTGDIIMVKEKINTD